MGEQERERERETEQESINCINNTHIELDAKKVGKFGCQEARVEDELIALNILQIPLPWLVQGR